MSSNESETLPVFEDGALVSLAALASLATEPATLVSLRSPGGLTLDPARDDHRSVLDELKDKLPFVDLENGGARLVTVKLGEVPVSVEITPTPESVSVTLVGSY